MKNRIIAISLLQSFILFIIYHKKTLIRYFYSLDSLPLVIGNIERKHAQFLDEVGKIQQSMVKHQEQSRKDHQDIANQSKESMESQYENLTMKVSDIQTKIDEILVTQRINELKNIPLFRKHPSLIPTVSTYDKTKYTELLTMLSVRSARYKYVEEVSEIQFFKSGIKEPYPITNQAITYTKNNTIIGLIIPSLKQKVKMMYRQSSNTYHLIVNKQQYLDLIERTSSNMKKEDISMIKIEQNFSRTFSEIKIHQSIVVRSSGGGVVTFVFGFDVQDTTNLIVVSNENIIFKL